MSSIIIKGMKMPKSCLVCPCSGTDITDDGKEVWVCEASKLRRLTIEDKIERRPEWCPLVEIQPHGRLIDADALLKSDADYEHLLFDTDGSWDCVALCYDRDTIKDAPTIIPAEEGE